jgi:hypothetical protein
MWVLALGGQCHCNRGGHVYMYSSTTHAPHKGMQHATPHLGALAWQNPASGHHPPGPRNGRHACYTQGETTSSNSTLQQKMALLAGKRTHSVAAKACTGLYKAPHIRQKDTPSTTGSCHTPCAQGKHAKEAPRTNISPLCRLCTADAQHLCARQKKTQLSQTQLPRHSRPQLQKNI